MRFSWFIARRIIGQRAHRSSVSGPIITIGIIAIALGVITMLIALGTGVGLQNKIGEKVASFSGHIRVTSLENSQGLETKKPIKDVSLLTKNIFALPNTKAVQSVAYVPGVVLNNQAFDGIIFKGIDDSFQMDFFSFFGGTTDLTKPKTDQLWMSHELAKKLSLSIGDRVPLYFAADLANRPKRRTCTLV